MAGNFLKFFLALNKNWEIAVPVVGFPEKAKRNPELKLSHV